MPRKKHRTYPGSIFEDKGHLYIKFKGKKKSTGLKATKKGWEMSELLLEQMWMNYNKLGNLGTQRIKINDAFKEFLAFKINLYDKTRRNYQNAFKSIITDNYYLYVDKVEKDIQNYLKTTKHGAVSINTYLTNLQVFLNFCAKKKWIERTTFKSDYKKKETERENESYSDEEIEKYLTYFRSRDNEVALLIEFMLETGARIVDCLTLTPSQIKPEEPLIIWKNKITKNDEPRPITKKALSILQSLPKRDGQVWRWTYRGAGFLNKKLRIANKDLKIDARGRSWQEFRVTFRMKLLRRRIPKEYAMWLLRHKTPEVTEIYTHYQQKEIMNLVEE
ncbi:MAG: tyrosine-type recombinase/integrase [Bacteroidetes bacterium]|nr:tyrosine-type recombinase/integrase [Bacteroidota bacterium]